MKIIKLYKNKKGFTILELLVVIAIIGILSSIVMVLLSGPREKSRDARRISDINQIKTALEFYSNDNNEYPVSGSLLPLIGEYLPDMPKDPFGDNYNYFSYTSANFSQVCTLISQDCIYYHLGTDLENSDHVVLKADDDIVTNNISGDDSNGCLGALDRYCYDVVP